MNKKIKNIFFTGSVLLVTGCGSGAGESLPAENKAPIVNAGSNVSTVVHSSVILTATAADSDGTIADYTWSENGVTLGTSARLEYTPSLTGAHRLTITVMDNQGATASDNIVVMASEEARAEQPDTIAPTITLIGAPSMRLTVGETYSEEGATASDNKDGDITSGIIITGNVNTTTAGTYTVRYNVSDDAGNAASTVTRTVTISETPNHAPTANNGSIVLNQDASKTFRLSANDVDGDALTYPIYVSPAYGTLSGQEPNITYTPTPGFFGTDSFSFKAYDGKLYSQLRTVSITVNRASDTTRPTMTLTGASTMNLTVGQPYTEQGASANDNRDGDITSRIITSGNVNTATIGTYVITYSVSDAAGNTAMSVIRTVNVSQAPDTTRPTISLNGAPSIRLIVGEAYSEQGATASDDRDGDITSRVSISGNVNTAAAGQYLINYSVSDIAGNAAILVTRTVTVSEAPNHAPTASNESITLNQDASKTFTLRANDVDGDTLTYPVYTSPAHGTLSGQEPNITYTPNAGYFGADSFTFKAYDGKLYSQLRTVTITVTEVPAGNRAPVAKSKNVSMDWNTGMFIDLEGTDADGDTLTYTIVSQPSHLREGFEEDLANDLPSALYYSAVGYHGTDSFTYRVYDGKVYSNTATVNITINNTNSQPRAYNRNYRIERNTNANIVLQSMDSDHDPITYHIVAQPSHGSVSGSAESRIYQPETNFVGTDSFTYKVNDGKEDSDVKTITIEVYKNNRAPIANAQSLNIEKDTSKPFTLTGSDADRDTLTYKITAQPTHGTLTGTAPSMNYVPNTGYTGDDQFKFLVNDGTVDSEEKTVSVVVFSNDANSDTVSISGKVTYDLVKTKYSHNGLDYDNTVRAPSRWVVVEAIGANGEQIAKTITDTNGNYIFNAINKNSDVKIRISAIIEHNGKVKVVNNTNGDALYVVEGSLRTSGTSNSKRDLHVPSGWTGSSYGSSRRAAPFAILGTIQHSMEMVIGAEHNINFPELKVNWSKDNKPVGGSKSEGKIGTSHYTGGNLYILGAANTDTDEYDDHVIAHEWGHYYEDKFSRADSIGGSHSFGDFLDIRIAFGEGFGNAVSAMALRDPIYFDTMHDKQGNGWNMNIESGSESNKGWFSEGSIQHILYDLFDSAQDTNDNVALGFGALHSVFTNEQKNSPAFTSIFSFVKYMKENNPAISAEIDAIVAGENIATINDIYGAGRTNHANLYQYHTLTVGQTTNVCAKSTYANSYNRPSNRGLIKFNVSTPGSYNIQFTKTKGTSEGVYKMFKSSPFAYNGLFYARTGATNLGSGQYLLDLYSDDASYDICYDITVTPN